MSIKLPILLQKKESMMLVGMVLVAFLLRIYLIPQNLFFGPEQGIDFQAIRRIVVEHKFTLIGAKTDIPGIFHGPLYYYITAVPFFISHGNPVIVSFFLIFLHALTIIPLYMLGKVFFSKRVGILASLLFIFSFEAVVSSRWLSGQPLAIPLACTFLLFLYRYIQGKDKNLFFIALLFGCISQLEFLNLIFFTVFLGIIGICFYKRVLQTNLLVLISSSILAVGISLGPFIIFDIRHNFLMLHSIQSLLYGSKGFYISYTGIVKSVLEIYAGVFSRTIFPQLPVLGEIFFIVTIVGLSVAIKINKTHRIGFVLLLCFLLTPAFSLFLLHQAVLEHFLLPCIPMILVICAMGISSILEKKYILGLLIFLFIIIANWIACIAYLPENKNVFFQATQPFLRYKDEVKTIDTVYTDAQGSQFAFQAYTIPYWSQQGWEYLFWYFGSTRYHNFPNPITHHKLYVIVQHDPNPYQTYWLHHIVPLWGTQIKKISYGDIRLLILQVKG